MSAERFGKYSLLHKLATGGMGEVWLARQTGPAGFDRFVAIKRLLPNLAENNEFVQMFLDEARLAARLTHPNICQVYEFGREDGSYYLAMEYMHGESLSSMLERSIKERKPLSQPVVAFIVAQALEGLHFAHEAKDESGRPLNLVHRDISPSNIFVTYDGQVKLLDFGIAKAAHRITQTVVGSIKGKFGYIAPEVYKGLTIDRRVDLFAMGVVLWEMLTRRRLYKRAAEYEILRAIVEEEPPDPRSLDSSVTPELSATTLKALSKLPGERYQTALEMRRAISIYLRGIEEEMDPQRMGEVMTALYGQVWIDLRSSVLESFKDASGAVANADMLNPGRTSSSVSQVGHTAIDSALPGAVGADAPNFSQQVSPAPARSAGSRPSRANIQRMPTPLPVPPVKSGAGLGIVVGILLTVAGAISVAAFAAHQRRTSDPLPVEAASAATDPAVPGQAQVQAPAPNTEPQRPAALAAQVPDAKLPGTFTVSASPKGALVQFDDGEDRAAPSTYASLVPGTHHRVLVHLPGFEPKTYEFDVKAGQNQTFDVSLAQRQKIMKASNRAALKSRPTSPTTDPQDLLNPKW